MKTALQLIGPLACVVALAGCDIDFDDDGRNMRMKNFTDERAVTTEKRVDYRLEAPVGTVQVSAGPAGKVFKIDVDYDERRYEPRLNYQVLDGGGKLDFRFETHRQFSRRNAKTHVNLQIDPELESNLAFRTGVGKSELDLSRIRVKDLDLEAGVGETIVSVHEPNPVRCQRVAFRAGVGAFRTVGLGNANFQRLSFEGGVGEARLDLTGDWKADADAEVKVGVGSVEITLPRGIGVDLRTRKSFMSGISLYDFERRSDNEWVSEDYNRAKVRLHLNIETGIGNARLRWN